MLATETRIVLVFLRIAHKGVALLYK